MPSFQGAYRSFGAFYARSFNRHPWLTLAVANGTLGVIADSLAQTLERVQNEDSGSGSKEQQPRGASADTPWDYARSGRFLAFGVGMAPLLAEWNKFIEYRFPLRASASASAGSAGSAASTGAAAGAAGAARAGAGAAATAATLGRVSLAALGKRVAFDQILFAPFGLACFVGTMGALEHRSVEGVRQKFSEMYTPALLANWQVWPAIQLLNFRFVPLRFRVPFTSACGIAWTLYLSLLQAASAGGGAAGGAGGSEDQRDAREAPGYVR